MPGRDYDTLAHAHTNTAHALLSPGPQEGTAPLCRCQTFASMLATAVAWLAQLPAQQKLAVLLGAYGFSAAPLLFWIAWRVITQLRGTQKVHSAPDWPHAAQHAANGRPPCLLLAMQKPTASVLARVPWRFVYLL